MRTITIASQKGGAGKSTLCLHLSVLAQETGQTILVDLDPQGSVTFWYGRREAEEPGLVVSTAAKLPTVLDAARDAGVAYAIIDTAPHDSASMATAMRAADFVLIPARPSALDLHAVGATLAMARELKKPHAVVLTQTPAKRAFGDPSAVIEARAYLQGQGARVLPAYISARVISAQSIIAGLAVIEMEPDGAAAAEYRALWRWIVAQEELR